MLPLPQPPLTISQHIRSSRMRSLPRRRRTPALELWLVRTANVCRLQENTRDDRRCRTEGASTSWRDGRILIHQTRGGIDFHLVFPFLSSYPFASPLCTGRRRGLPGTFLLSLLPSCLPSFFPFLFFLSSAEQRYPWCSLQHITNFGPGARSPEVEARYGSKLRRLYIPHSLLAGPAARAAEQEVPLFRARIYLATFPFMYQGWNHVLD
jgi:hypothetical protein